MEGPKAAPSFLASAQTSHPHVAGHRTRTIQRYHPHCNELAIPNRATAKRSQGKRPSSHNFTLQTSLGFVWMGMYKCFAIEYRVVAKLAKLLSRWRTLVIQDGAEFCIWWIHLTHSDRGQIGLSRAIPGYLTYATMP